MFAEDSSAGVLEEVSSPCGQWPFYKSQPFFCLASDSILWSLREKPFPPVVNCPCCNFITNLILDHHVPITTMLVSFHGQCGVFIDALKTSKLCQGICMNKMFTFKIC